MKRNLFVYFSAIITFIVFTFTSCYSPFVSYLPKEAAVYQLEIGKGTPYYVYLDSNYSIIDKPIGINDRDPGKTAILVDDNKLAEGIMAFAETTQDGATVRLINKNNNSTIYMFFEQGKNFPTSFIIETQGERFNAFLSNYDTQKECYSIAFEKDGEFVTQDNVIMNKNILTIYNDDLKLNKDQNTRIRNIYTALGVYASLYNEFSNEDSIIFLNLGWLKPFFVAVFVVVAVVAFIAAIVLATPIVIGSVSILIPGLGNLTAFTALGISVGAGIAGVLTDMIPVDEGGGGGSGGIQNGPTLERIVATIKKDGKNIKKDAVYYIAPGSYIDFEIDFILPSTDSVVSYGAYESSINRWYPSTFNHEYFDAKAISNNASETALPFNPVLPLPSNFKLRISRNLYDGTGTNGGYLDFVLVANTSLVVNTNNYYFDIYDDKDNKMVTTNSVYVIRVTIRSENEVIIP
jgi:hypothetical protein